MTTLIIDNRKITSPLRAGNLPVGTWFVSGNGILYLKASTDLYIRGTSGYKVQTFDGHDFVYPVKVEIHITDNLESLGEIN